MFLLFQGVFFSVYEGFEIDRLVTWKLILGYRIGRKQVKIYILYSYSIRHPWIPSGKKLRMLVFIVFFPDDTSKQ